LKKKKSEKKMNECVGVAEREREREEREVMLWHLRGDLGKDGEEWECSADRICRLDREKFGFIIFPGISPFSRV